MPRANRRRRDDVPLERSRALSGAPARQTYAGRDWLVRAVAGTATDRAYRCPGCEQDLPAGIPHVVVWPADGVGGIDDRRHWHTQCWSARDRRRPHGPVR